MNPGEHGSAATAAADLERGRAAYERAAWDEAYRCLRPLDDTSELGVREVEILSWSSALSGRDQEMLKYLARLHDLHRAAGRLLPAARAAFWSGNKLFALGEQGQAGAWFARAERLLEEHGAPAVEHGYLRVPDVRRKLAQGRFDEAHEVALAIREIGREFRDSDLVALGANLDGCALVGRGELEAGLERLDEAMLLTTTRALSPVVMGLVYCNVIATCHRVYALQRAREWTRALSEFCEAQPELVPFTASCQVHRAEVLNLCGEWQAAIEQARKAQRPHARPQEREARGLGFYQEAEVLRLTGRFDEAEAAYELASQSGSETQPGLALLRLAQGNTKAALAALRRVLAASTVPLERARFLPAAVDVLLATGETDEAANLADELERLASAFPTESLTALASQSRGAVLLARGQAEAALEPLRRAFRVWLELDAPYRVAELRVLLARAYRALDDEDGAKLELGAAREVFARLGAAPALTALDGLDAAPAPGGTTRSEHGLTPRELEVLRLVAAGKTNKGIASQLSLSEKTVDRHVSNIFVKLDVPTRAAATAYAYSHGLIE